MISANEAKTKTKDIINNYEKDLKRLEKQINAAILLGEFSISGTGYLSHLVINKLHELGYEIELNNEHANNYDPLDPKNTIMLFTSAPYYVIKWS